MKQREQLFITKPMYEKGRSFVMAAGLLKAYEGHYFVYLHLLCQGFENIGKSILLLKDYEKYNPQLKNPYHHNLDKILSELQKAHNPNILSLNAQTELLSLNDFYKKQQLRYGDRNDFYIECSQLKANNLHGELVQLIGKFNHFFK